MGFKKIDFVDVTDLEKYKFVLVAEDEVAVRTLIAGGGVTDAGFTEVLKVNTIEVDTSAQELTAGESVTQLLSIFNTSETETLYYGDANTVTADRALGTTAGWEIGPLETENLPIAYGKSLWLISTDTIVVKVRELG